MCSFITVQLPLTSIPLFPLGLLPLPGERLALHIFEPRYQRLFHALEHNELEEIGIAYHTPSNPHSFDAPIYGGVVDWFLPLSPVGRENGCGSPMREPVYNDGDSLKQSKQ